MRPMHKAPVGILERFKRRLMDSLRELCESVSENWG